MTNMTKAQRRWSRWIAPGFLVLCLLPLASVLADVKITFLPPPHEGTISLGIYNPTGQLVRTLFREATDKDFVVGLNGFITSWDGKDDAGQSLPPGKYSARGYSVGKIQIEGVAFHCNEWMSEEDSPRIQKITSIGFLPEGELQVKAQLPGNRPIELSIDTEGQFRVVESDPSDKAAQSDMPVEIPGLEKLVASSPGRDGTLWVIDRTATGTEVKQYAPDKELLRRLSLPADQPEPWQLAASPDKDLIFLLERTPKLERLRGLILDSAADESAPAAETPASSTWKTIFSKTVISSETFAAIADQLGRDKPVVAKEKFQPRLLPNPLFQEAVHEVTVSVAIDKEGAYFVDASGLLLRRITLTPHLKWAVMSDDASKVITIFQSDGTVVEEFKASRFADLMAFDAGEYRLKADKVTR